MSQLDACCLTDTATGSTCGAGYFKSGSACVACTVCSAGLYLRCCIFITFARHLRLNCVFFHLKHNLHGLHHLRRWKLPNGRLLEHHKHSLCYLLVLQRWPVHLNSLCWSAKHDLFFLHHLQRWFVVNFVLLTVVVV